VLLPQLRRVRWAVRATLVLGVAASVVANILHALDNPISQAIAAWPPLALLLTVELISRVPVHRRSLAFARLFATATIAGIAAWVSYWHMAGVAARYGETGASPYLLPLSVDGLIVVASICLVELGGRISSLEAEAIATAKAAREAAQSAAQVAAAALIPAPRTPALAPAALAPAAAASTHAASTHAASTPANSAPATSTLETSTVAASTPATLAPAAAMATAGAPQLAAPGLIPVPAASHASSTNQASSAARASSAAASGIRRSTATAAALAEVAAALPRTGLPKTRGAEVSAFSPTVTRQGRAALPARTPASTTPTPATARTAKSGNPAKSTPKSAPKTRRSPAETIAAAAKIKTRRPDITDVDLAAELGISASRWRTIRREAGHNGDLRLAA